MSWHVRVAVVLIGISAAARVAAAYSQEDDTALRSSFRKLVTAGSATPFTETNRFHLITESADLLDSIEDDKIAMGFYCKQYRSSEKLAVLEEIHRIFRGDTILAPYVLIDQNGEAVKDLLQYNCSGMRSALRSINTVNQAPVASAIATAAGRPCCRILISTRFGSETCVPTNSPPSIGCRTWA